MGRVLRGGIAEMERGSTFDSANAWRCANQQITQLKQDNERLRAQVHRVCVLCVCPSSPLPPLESSDKGPGPRQQPMCKLATSAPPSPAHEYSGSCPASLVLKCSRVICWQRMLTCWCGHGALVALVGPVWAAPGSWNARSASEPQKWTRRGKLQRRRLRASTCSRRSIVQALRCVCD